MSNMAERIARDSEDTQAFQLTDNLWTTVQEVNKRGDVELCFYRSESEAEVLPVNPWIIKDELAEVGLEFEGYKTTSRQESYLHVKQVKNDAEIRVDGEVIL